MRARWLLAPICLLAFVGCSGARPASKTGVYAVTVQSVCTMRRDTHATYVHPVADRHPGYLVVFVTGDDGWFGTSRAIFGHLADEGYTLAGFSAPEALRDVARSGERISTRSRPTITASAMPATR